MRYCDSGSLVHLYPSVSPVSPVFNAHHEISPACDVLLQITDADVQYER